GLDRLEPFRRHLNLHYHVLVKLRELAALFDHLLRLSRRDLEGDRAVDEGEDVLDHLGPLPAGLCDERRIRRHPVEDAPGGRLAVQFLALKTLLASPSQMGLLGAMGTFPFLLIGLLVGVWVDRHRRRPILIAGDLGRGFIVVAIATLTLLGIVRMEYLYVLGFATGILTVFFDVSYQAYLPALVPRGQIVEGNSKLEASNTTAQVTGPVLAGFALKAV